MLWDYAKNLIDTRLTELRSLMANTTELSKLRVCKNYCKSRLNHDVKKFRRPVKSTFGIFRHPGHKGPNALELPPDTRSAAIIPQQYFSFFKR